VKVVRFLQTFPFYSHGATFIKSYNFHNSYNYNACKQRQTRFFSASMVLSLWAMSEKSSAIGVTVMDWSLIVDDGDVPCDECRPGEAAEHETSEGSKSEPHHHHGSLLFRRRRLPRTKLTTPEMVRRSMPSALRTNQITIMGTTCPFR